MWLVLSSSLPLLFSTLPHLPTLLLELLDTSLFYDPRSFQTDKPRSSVLLASLHISFTSAQSCIYQSAARFRYLSLVAAFSLTLLK